METIKIEVVKVNGKLVGRTFSDRWNLETLGLTEIPVERNQSTIKRLRRQNVDLTFSTVKGDMVAELSETETEAMRPVNIFKKLLRLA